jgi:SAM-dependent methyltransferase
MAHENELPTKLGIVAELGPGDSLGIGLAALLSNTEKYYAFDVVEHASNQRNIDIFLELVKLFQERENIPEETEFPEVKPYLKSYEFPRALLSDALMREALNPKRIESIKSALLKVNGKNTPISYIAPWYGSKVLKEESVDMIYSQAVLEHVDDLHYTYERLYRWLKPGGFMSHQIDFRSHGTAKQWNGHWTHGDRMWSVIRGKRPYLLNRQPHSAHIEVMRQCGFEIVCDIKVKDATGVSRKQLAERFKAMSDDDLSTSGAFIQAIKKPDVLQKGNRI